MGLRTTSLLAACVAVAGFSAGLAGQACAQGNRLGEALLGRAPSQSQATPAPLIGRYVADKGPSFILDRSSAVPLLRFEDSAEVWVLQGRPSGGGMVYFNDLGQMVLRATRLGGLTLYTEARPQGLAVSMTGTAAPIEPILRINDTVAQQRLSQANRRMARAAGRPVELQVLARGPVPAALAVDATTLIAEAFENTAQQPGGARVLAGIRVVSVVTSASGATSVTLQNGVLNVTLRPDQGPAGRPSSRRVLVTLIGR